MAKATVGAKTFLVERMLQEGGFILCGRNKQFSLKNDAYLTNC